MYGIILAGGSGSRLWPLSRELYPKQLLNLNSDKSLLQSTFERLEYCMDKHNIISITNTKHVSNVRMQLTNFLDNPVVLSEPVSKNTAPAIALAVKYIAQKHGEDEIIIVVPSDHLIENNSKFFRCCYCLLAGQRTHLARRHKSSPQTSHNQRYWDEFRRR